MKLSNIVGAKSTTETPRNSSNSGGGGNSNNNNQPQRRDSSQSARPESRRANTSLAAGGATKQTPDFISVLRFVPFFLFSHAHKLSHLPSLSSFSLPPSRHFSSFPFLFCFVLCGVCFFALCETKTTGFWRMKGKGKWKDAGGGSEKEEREGR